MKLFVWDFHGTLEEGNEFAVQEICEKVMGKTIGIEKVRELYGRTWYDYFMHIEPSLSEKRANELVDCTKSISEEVCIKHIRPADNALNVLEEVKKQGDYNVVLTNTREDRVEGFLDLVKIKHLIDEYIGIPKSNEFSKHNTIDYKASQIDRLAKKGTYEKVIVIGDSEEDILAGKKAKAVTFMIDRWDRQPETSADYRIKDLSEVLRVYQ